MVIPDLGQVSCFCNLLPLPALMETSDERIVWAFVSAILKLHSFINSLQHFWSKYSVFGFALSTSALSESRDEELPQTASVETSQYFQVTASSIWLFYCLFFFFKQKNLQPDKCLVQKEIKVPYICHFSRYAKYVVVGYFPPLFRFMNKKNQWRSCSCDIRLHNIPGKQHLWWNQPKTLSIVFFFIRVLIQGRMQYCCYFFPTSPYVTMFLSFSIFIVIVNEFCVSHIWL